MLQSRDFLKTFSFEFQLQQQPKLPQPRMYIVHVELLLLLCTSGPVNQVESRIKSNINHIGVRFVARPFLPSDSHQTL